MIPSSAVRRALAGLLVAFAAASPALAQIDTLKVMIGANPGGGYDQTGRGIAAAMQAAGAVRAVTFENRGGAGGTIGLAQFVNTEKGNPNALVVTGAVMVGAIETARPPVTLRNATPIARLFADTLVVVVPAASKIRSMSELVAQMKAAPGSVSWGGGSRGSVDHILVGLVAQAAGVEPTKANYIPFAGGGEALAAILGGQVSVGVAGLSEFLPYVKDGRMRALAVSSPAPVQGIPTLREQGLAVEMQNWRGVYGAPGITPEQQKALVDAVVRGTQTPQWKETLAKNEWTPVLLTGAEFGAYVESESKRIGGILRELGMAK
ncbi:MAG TPA: tripartite tricarboxylate transporter substrate-binding protein [Burkholderiaceae bacterium]|nr:tripartite tricarboxylate transporter substrate-binding protein [Burkholderiaceae bacterium]